MLFTNLERIKVKHCADAKLSSTIDSGEISNCLTYKCTSISRIKFMTTKCMSLWYLYNLLTFHHSFEWYCIPGVTLEHSKVKT